MVDFMNVQFYLNNANLICIPLIQKKTKNTQQNKNLTKIENSFAFFIKSYFFKYLYTLSICLTLRTHRDMCTYIRRYSNKFTNDEKSICIAKPIFIFQYKILPSKFGGKI